MTTISDLGITGLQKDQKFKNPKSVIVDYYQIISDKITGYSGDFFNVLIYYTDGTTGTSSFYDYEIGSTISDFELIEEVSDNDKYYWEKYQSEKPKPLCFHSNKKKVIVFNLSGYWYCPDCHLDMGTLTEEEFYQAVKEQTGGKPVKKAPPMGQSRGRR